MEAPALAAPSPQPPRTPFPPRASCAAPPLPPPEQFATVHGSAGVRRPPPPHAAASRKHRANHQRNLSLDFRSMGIVLPPLPALTHSGSHQRNRSLDSVLQKIPEVEAGGDTPQHPTPSSPPLKPSLSFNFSDAPSLRLRNDLCRVAPAGRPVVVRRDKDRYDQSSLGSDDSGICGSEGDATRESSAERVQSVEALETGGTGSDCEVKSVYSETLESEGTMGEPECEVPLGEIEVEVEEEEEEMEGEAADLTLVAEEYVTKTLDSSLDPLGLTPPKDPCEDPQDPSDTTPTPTLARGKGTKQGPSTRSKRPPCDVPREQCGGGGGGGGGVLSALMMTQRTVGQSVCGGGGVLTKTKLAEKQSLLLRLFESKMFDMSMAVSYLYKCKEPGVQQYIGNRLFSMPPAEAHFFLPQLVNMYVQTYEVAEVLHPFLMHFCRHDSTFALQCAWLLEAFATDSTLMRKRSHGTKLKNLILSDELRPKQDGMECLPGGGGEGEGAVPRLSLCTRIKEHPSPGSNPGSPVTDIPPPFIPPAILPHPSRRGHQRSRSDATVAAQGHLPAIASRGHKRTPSSGQLLHGLSGHQAGWWLSCCPWLNDESLP